MINYDLHSSLEPYQYQLIDIDDTLLGLEFIISTARSGNYNKTNGMIDFINNTSDISIKEMLGVDKIDSIEDVEIATEGLVDIVVKIIEKIFNIVLNIIKSIINILSKIIPGLNAIKIPDSIKITKKIDDFNLKNNKILSIKNLKSLSKGLTAIQHESVFAADELCTLVSKETDILHNKFFDTENCKALAKKTIDRIKAIYNRELQYVTYCSLITDDEQMLVRFKINEQPQMYTLEELGFSNQNDFTNYNELLSTMVATNKNTTVRKVSDDVNKQMKKMYDTVQRVVKDVKRLNDDTADETELQLIKIRAQNYQKLVVLIGAVGSIETQIMNMIVAVSNSWVSLIIKQVKNQ